MSCSCGTVTHKMLEILVGTARTPKCYRKIRSKEIRRDYEPHLAASREASEALLVLVGDATEDEISETGQACYRSIVKIADADRRGMAISNRKYNEL